MSSKTCRDHDPLPEEGPLAPAQPKFGGRTSYPRRSSFARRVGVRPPAVRLDLGEDDQKKEECFQKATGGEERGHCSRARRRSEEGGEEERRRSVGGRA